MNEIRNKKVKKKDVGVDGINFSHIVTGKVAKFKEFELINKYGYKYGKVTATKDGFDTYICIPKFDCTDNRTPFKIADAINLEIIREDVETHLKNAFGLVPESYVKSIEINVTQDIGDNVKASDVIDLIGSAMTTSNKAGIFYRSRDTNELGRVLCSTKAESYSFNKEHRYLIKVYNKSLQLKQLRVKDVQGNLLRIELRLYGRTIKKLFGERVSMGDILTKKSLVKCINEYIHIMDKEVINNTIIPYMNQCVTEIVEELCSVDKVSTGILNSRKLLFDKEILRRALKRYYILTSSSKEATVKNLVSYYCNNNKVNIPEGVISTIKMFHL